MARLQDSPREAGGQARSVELRALELLAALRVEQAGLVRDPGLAWERARFREAFLEPGPAQRIRAFLEGRRRAD